MDTLLGIHRYFRRRRNYEQFYAIHSTQRWNIVYLKYAKTDLKKIRYLSRLYVLRKRNLYLKPFPTRKLLTQVASLISPFKNLGKSNINPTQTLLEIKDRRRHYHLFYKVSIIPITKSDKSIVKKKNYIPPLYAMRT